MAAAEQTLLSGAASEGALGDTGGETMQRAESDPLLAGLRPSKPKKRTPGTTWDGRVAGMSLKEYREKKWSLDANYAKVERRGPSFTCRAALHARPPRTLSTFQVGEVHESFKNVHGKTPMWSMGCLPIFAPKDKSPGPSEYLLPNSMDSKPHPMLKKHCGPRFGTERLLHRDEPLPGPGEYDVSCFKQGGTCKRVANYTIQGREAWQERSAAPDPGPGEYAVEGIMRHGKETPIHWNMQGKTEPLAVPRGARRVIGPGAPHYNPPGAGMEASIGGKWKNEHTTRQRPPLWKLGTEVRGLC